MKKNSQRPQDAKRRAEVLDLLLKGLTQRAVAKQARCSANLVTSVVKDNAHILREPQTGRPPDFERNEQIRALWRRHKSCAEIVQATGASVTQVRMILREHGGMLPPETKRSPLRLSLEQREDISRYLVAKWSFRAIAQRLDKAPSSISREVNNNGGRQNYRAWAAERRCHEQARRPKAAKLVSNQQLHDEVQSRLEKKHSPRRIALCLMAEFPDQTDMRISPEAIYQSLFIQGRGALRRELTSCLRTGRAVRKQRSREKRVGKIKDMVMISERPAEVEDRAIPGHWEGDLIIGKNGASAIATLVERKTRYLMLLKVANKEAATIREALGAAVKRLPQELFKSLTWDQGTEMAEHATFSVDTGVEVYFCDPHSPWQRGSNENTNGLIRQYFPKGTVLSGHSQNELDAVARELNERPRETLGLKTPAFMLDQLLR